MPELRVYPRACGGTAVLTFVIDEFCLEGLSPRLRGNLQQLENGLSRAIWVYPRACGGTLAPVAPSCDGVLGEAGLSPRLRGNLRSMGRPRARVCMGLSPRLRGNLLAVATRRLRPPQGLSPRLRGNPLRHYTLYRQIRLVAWSASCTSPGIRRRHPRSPWGLRPR